MLDFYIENGMNVFVYNYRGYSLSQGTPSIKVRHLFIIIDSLRVFNKQISVCFRIFDKTQRLLPCMLDKELENRLGLEYMDAQLVVL